jgi:hypothetical protein
VPVLPLTSFTNLTRVTYSAHFCSKTDCHINSTSGFEKENDKLKGAGSKGPMIVLETVHNFRNLRSRGTKLHLHIFRLSGSLTSHVGHKF